MSELSLKMLVLIVLLLTSGFFTSEIDPSSLAMDRFVSYELNPNLQRLQFYWKDEADRNYFNFNNLKRALLLENKELVFAMNGGMYNKDGSPQGLFVENGVRRAPIDTAPEGYGNFYLQPNGIFYLTKTQDPVICKTQDYPGDGNIAFATQSGPMLVIEGEIHPKLNQGSPNVHIRNGVGLLPNGNLLFVISKEKVNFYDFACFFQEKGCENALYLDGFVSKMYLPEAGYEQMEGTFGVIIAEYR